MYPLWFVKTKNIQFNVLNSNDKILGISLKRNLIENYLKKVNNSLYPNIIFMI